MVLYSKTALVRCSTGSVSGHIGSKDRHFLYSKNIWRYFGYFVMTTESYQDASAINPSNFAKKENLPYLFSNSFLNSFRDLPP